jgi:hypothetical protein
METEDQGMNIDEIHTNLITSKWQWLMGYMHPEVFSPGRVPQDISYPTHTFNSKFNDVVNVWKSSSDVGGTVIQHPEHAGKFWIYFAPVNDLLSMTTNPSLDNLHNNLTLNTTYYATSNGPLRLTDFESLYPIDIGEENLGRKSSGPFQGYKKLRVNSAAIVITPTGPLKSNSGVIKVGYTFKRADVDFSKINFQNFDNYFQTSKIYPVKNDTNIICRYRPLKNLLDDFAPYEPCEEFPFFVVYGEGISPEVTFNIKVVRHFEGVVLSQYSQLFYENWQMKPMEFYIQKLAAAAIKDPGIITMENIPQFKDNVTNTISKVSHIFAGVFDKVYSDNPSLFEDNAKLNQEGMYYVTKKIVETAMPDSLKQVAKDMLPFYDPSKTVQDNIRSLSSRYGTDLTLAPSLGNLLNNSIMNYN